MTASPDTRPPLDAAAILDAYDRARPIDRARWRSPASTDEALALQHAVNARRVARGERPVGRKIGFTNREMWRVYGVGHPIWAPVWDTTLLPLASGTAVLSAARYVAPKFEPEIALRIGRAPASAAPADVAQAVDAVAHAVEIVQSPWPGWRFDAAEAIAAQALHGTLVLGPSRPFTPADAEPLSRLEVSAHCDGALACAGRGANALGGPVLALSHLVAELARRGEALSPGEWVTTGTLADAMPIAAGQRWETRLTGTSLPGLSLRFIE